MRRTICTLLALVLCLVPATALAERELAYRELARQQGRGTDEFKWGALVTNREELQTAWDRFDMRGEPPAVGFERRIGVFAGSGGSSSCPLYIVDATFRRSDNKIIVRVSKDPGGDGLCTDDWVPTTYLLGISKQEVPSVGRLSVLIRVRR